ncbi:MAG: PKD domain-containing protein [Desulfobacterales bacterium]|nr:PKD domain-containing protein [Desulfobacterales bacterium]
MRSIRTRIPDIIQIITICCVFLVCLPVSVLSGETYKFERMWPVLHQPWYFNSPSDVAVGSKGFIYVADMNGHYIWKFTPDGFLVTKWGGRSTEDSPEDGKLNQPRKIAIDSKDFIYVADSSNHRIQKFTSDGRFVAKWGSRGCDEEGEIRFNRPKGIAVDSKDIIYVADTNNDRIQKFTSDGNFIAKWGAECGVTGNLDQPSDIAVDSKDLIYVVDRDNDRIQKFTSEGAFVNKWGINGVGDGEFDSPCGIAIDSEDFIYVADTDNHRIQKFNSDGVFMGKWGNLSINPYFKEKIEKYRGVLTIIDGVYEMIYKHKWNGSQLLDHLSRDTRDGEFRNPYGIGIDKNGFIYVADKDNHRIQKFDSEGKYIAKWGSASAEEGEFQAPICITSDSNQNVIYVTDSNNYRIQKFDLNGNFITEWGRKGSGNGEFEYPTGVAVDSEGFVYVTDSFNSRVQKFTSEGVFITKWGTEGSGDGEFIWPINIAIDKNNFVYVADPLNFRIQKYTSDGIFRTSWGHPEASDSNIKYLGAVGLAVDSDGFIYAADSFNHRIYKFTSDGAFTGIKWGREGTGDGEFAGLFSISVESAEDGDFIYAVDSYNGRIQKFTEDGTFITAISSFGPDIGQLNFPVGVCVANNGKIYVSDTGSRRIQVFRKGLDSDEVMKAIVVAGSKNITDHLWAKTQICTNFAYRALIFQGFTKDTICYLSSNTNLDLDGDGKSDVDNPATNDELEDAVETWASDADKVVIYLVDHGGQNTFHTKEGEELMSSELSTWVNTLQQNIPDTAIVIYDACYSGSFLPVLLPDSNKKRIVITSTTSEQRAYFLNTGSLSFSGFFWTHILNGLNVRDSFDLSRQVIKENHNPLLDDTGDGEYNISDGFLAEVTYIGNGIRIQEDAPVIASVSPIDKTINIGESLTFSAEITDDDDIIHIWGIVRPPNYLQAVSEDPIVDLPLIEFIHTKGNQYKGTYNNFDAEGVYQIAIFARDEKQNTSIPGTAMVTVENPLKRKAIIVIGDSLPGAEEIAVMAYNALSFQGYSDDDIYLMGPVSVIEDKMPVKSTLKNLNYAISEWAADNTWDVVIYFMGNGDKEFFHINPSEVLTAIDLDNLLDNLQNNIPGPIAVIYDGCHSESFLSRLIPSADKKRILIGSTVENQSANILFNGEVSFSNFFWTGVFNGETVKTSIVEAEYAIESYDQKPYLDANGNGTDDEYDSISLGNYTIGLGIMQAGEKPVIEDVSPGQYIKSQNSADIWADVSGDMIDRVWAMIISQPEPDQIPCIITDPPGIELLYNPYTERYEGTYDDFSVNGKYDIRIYAQNAIGKSSPKHTWVKQQCLNPIIITKFSALPASGNEPQTINFTDETTVSFTDEMEACNDIVSWYWEFGGNATSTEQNPTHTYLNSGTYKVKLTVIDAVGNTDSETATITINDTDPTAKASASTTAGNEPLAVEFTDNSQSYDGITSWKWEFGDGATSTNQNPAYTYTQNGVYTATLTVKESDGDTATATITITVNDTNPKAIASASSTSGNEPFTVHFTDNSQSYDGIIQWHWDFGDGTTSTDKNPTHSYTHGGLYKARLTVSEADGNESSTEIDIRVVQVTCTNPSFSSNKGTEPLTVNFKVSSCSDNKVVSWDFGDGQSSTDQNPTHTYTQDGVYTAKQTVTKSNGEIDTADITITVNNSHPHNTSISVPNTEGDEPFSTVFTPYSESYDGITSWEWNFGDGQTSTDKNPLHTYTRNGIYTVNLIAREADGNTDTAQITITVKDIPPGPTEIIAVPLDDTWKEPLTVNFEGISKSYDGIVSWEWDFGDGHTGSGRNATHSYTNDGMYTAKLTVREADGGTNSATLKIKVEDSPPGPPEILSLPPKGYEPLFVYLKGFSQSHDGIALWKWEFGDGETASGQNTKYYYREHGNYEVKLTVEEPDGDTDHTTFEIKVKDRKPAAYFSFSLTETEDLISITFKDRSMSHDDITSWHWDFGDGETSDERNPTHSYNQGVYRVTLTVEEDGDKNSYYIEINTFCPIVTTTIDSVTSRSAAFSGNVELVTHSSPVTSRGICWSTTTKTPSTEDNEGIITHPTETGSFTNSITGLPCNTTYYVRAYAGNTMGTAYGNTAEFTTKSEDPNITTSEIHSVTTRTAYGGGEVISNGGYPIVSRGICWNTTGNPTIYHYKKTADTTGIGKFECFITGLTHDTTYYVRAYVQNYIQLIYGPEIIFVTKSPALPSVTTAAPNSVTAITAISGGTVDPDDGGATVTARGVCWSTAQNPTTGDEHTSDSTGTGTFESFIAGLSPDTTYHTRAYAINAAGIKYGQQKSFFTEECNHPSVKTVEINSATSTTANIISEVFSGGGCRITARGVSWNTFGTPILEKGDYRTYDGAETGSYTSIIKGLTPGTTYYVRAYATNEVGKTAYGIIKEFFTLKSVSRRKITPYPCDIDGNGKTDLNDAALVLKMLAGMDVSDRIRADYTESGIDINGDYRIGIEEVVYILQRVAELK